MTEYLGPAENDPDQIIVQQDLDDLTVATARIEDGAVTEVKIQVKSITSNVIALGAILLDRLVDIASQTFLGRSTAGTGAPEAMTAAEARTALNVEDGAGVSLKDGNQELTGNRIVTIPSGTNYFLYVNLIDDTGANNKLTSIIVQPGTPRIVLTASETSVSSASLVLGAQGPDFLLAGSDISINGDCGTDGDVFTSRGLGVPTEWNPGVVHGNVAPNQRQLWFHADDCILYVWDGTRSYWISVNEYQVTGSSPTASSTSNDILRHHGMSMLVSSSERGFVVPHRMRVTGWIWKSGASVAVGRELALGKRNVVTGVTSTTFHSVTPAAAWEEYEESDLNEAFEPGDLLGLVAFGTETMVYSRCTVTYRRSPTVV